MKLFAFINKVLGTQVEPRQSFYSDGQLASERSYKGDKRHGPFKDYYPNGQLQREGSYKNGRPDGEWKLYHDNGQQSALCHFDEGENVGFWMDKNREGKTIAEYTYDDGVRRDYLPTELLKEEIGKNHNEIISHNNSYNQFNEQDKPVGIRYQYYNNGRLKSESQYYDNGRPRSESQYNINGDLDGPQQKWYDNGLTSEFIEYKDGKKHGAYMTWEYDGSRCEGGIYKEDEKVGLWNEFNQFGEIEMVNYPSFDKNAAIEMARKAMEIEQANKSASELFDKAMDSEQEEDRNQGIKLK